MIIQDQAQQMERWVQHYSELYSRENVVIKDTLNSIERQPVLEETNFSTNKSGLGFTHLQQGTWKG